MNERSYDNITIPSLSMEQTKPCKIQWQNHWELLCQKCQNPHIPILSLFDRDLFSHILCKQEEGQNLTSKRHAFRPKRNGIKPHNLALDMS